MFFLSVVPVAHAYFPATHGIVKTQTGAPVAGVWVKWTDKYGNFEFARTDSDGGYRFPGSDDPYWDAAKDIIVDTNLDGTPDQKQRNIVVGDQNVPFACQANPHTFSVVQPVTMEGAFSQVTKDLLNNIIGDQENNDIIFNPPGPTPTPLGRCDTDANCTSGEICVNNTCVIPTPTPVGRCNSDAECSNGQVCINHTCVAPTPTATPSGTITPTPSATPSGTITPTRTPTPTATPSGTITPTPIASGSAKCSCDGISSSGLFGGQSVTFNGFAKVEGTDVRTSQVQSLTFVMAKGDTIIANSGPVTVQIVENTATKVRYKGSWQTTLPQADPTNPQQYRLWYTPTCTNKVAMTASRTVLAAQAPSGGNLLDGILRFFTQLFGGNGAQNPLVPTPIPSVTPNPNKQLKLDSFTPAPTLAPTDPAEACYMIRFEL